MERRIPKKINPDPIAEAIIEIRFESVIPETATFGIVYKEINDMFPNNQELPILNLPEQIRKNDSNLRYKPYWKLSNENYDLNLGPRVIGLIAKKPYRGWEDFSNQLIQVLKSIKETEIVESLVRLGIRYVNFFEFNIYEKIDLELKFGNREYALQETYIKNVVDIEGHKVVVQIGNQSTYKTTDKPILGSTIDIDVMKTSLGQKFIDEPREQLDKAHSIEKNIFYDILNDDFVEKELSPEY